GLSPASCCAWPSRRRHSCADSVASRAMRALWWFAVLGACGSRPADMKPTPSEVLGEPIALGTPIIHRELRPGVIRRTGERDELVPARPPSIGAVAADAKASSIVTADELPAQGW